MISSYKLSKEARIRIETMVKTNNGFEIADTDLKLRGPGDLMGTQQSGALDLLIADLGKDGKILQSARQSAQAVLSDDPELTHRENVNIRHQIESMKTAVMNWSRIS